MTGRMVQWLACLLALAWNATAAELKLAANGTTEYKIVVPDTPTAKDRRAAGELAACLGKITGAEFPVVAESQFDGGKFLSIGDTALWRAHAGTYAVADLGDAGYAIVPAVDGVCFQGGPRRGAMNAVYAFLEEDLGCRWYTPRWDYIPVRPDLTLNLEPRSSVPAFPALRDPLTIASLDVDWSLRNRSEPLWVEIPEDLGGRASHFSPPWLAHSYDAIVPASELAAHPECFAMTADGGRTVAQRCPSNPLFRQRAVDFVSNELRSNPGADHVMVSMNDNYEVCHCPECTKLGTNRAHLELVNFVARAVAKEFPKAKVTTLAYFFVGMPPEGYVPEPNVSVWLCTDCVPDHERHIPARKNDIFAARMKAWAPIAPELLIWDYHVTYINNFIYDPTLYAMSDNLKYYRDNGVDGVQLQGPLGSGGEREGLRTWAFTKLMWNPDLNMTDLIDDYCHGVFGPAAEPIDRFYQSLYRRGVEGRGIIGNGNIVFDPQLREDGAAAFAQAYQLAGDNAELKARLDLESVPVRLMVIDDLNTRIEDPAYGDRDRTRAERDRNLRELEAIVEREKLVRYQMEGLTTDLLASKKLWDDALRPADLSPRALLIPAARAWVWRWTGPGNVRDEKSGLGLALQVPYTPNEYPIRWHFNAYPTLKHGGAFQIKLRLKARAASGAVLEVGSYSPQRGFQRSATIDGAAITPDYTWVDAGRLTLEPNPADGYLYIRALKDAKIEDLRVDAIVAEPVK